MGDNPALKAIGGVAKARGMAEVAKASGLGRSASAQRRRATATPSRKATNSEPSGASRAILLRMLSGMPGFLPFSIASPTRLAAPLTASDTSSIVDFASGLGSRPSYTSGGEDMSSAMGNLPDQQVVIE